MTDEFEAKPEVIEFVTQMHVLKRTTMPEKRAKSMRYLASGNPSFTP